MPGVNPLRQRVLDYLATFGLDGTEISQDFTEEGFHLCRPGADRDILHPWPDGVDVAWLESALLAADREDGRIG